MSNESENENRNDSETDWFSFWYNVQYSEVLTAAANCNNQNRANQIIRTNTALLCDTVLALTQNWINDCLMWSFDYQRPGWVVTVPIPERYEDHPAFSRELTPYNPTSE